jgi:ParB-like nuclease family protein
MDDEQSAAGQTFYQQIDQYPSETVPIGQLLTADTPRLDGLNLEHVRVLAEFGGELPPIIVHRPTMRVIDGMHRLRAAKLRARQEIEVRFFDGDETDSFVLAVRSNIAHGLPLSLADRTAAATRIMVAQPQWSDRAIARVTGLAHQTVGEIRRRSTGQSEQLNSRVGRDGKVRPLNSASARKLAAELIASDPAASLRQIAKAAGISPATARNVRERLRRGDDPVPPNQRRTEPAMRIPAGRSVSRPEAGQVTEFADGVHVTAILRTLRNDPSLRFNESGRRLLRLLGTHMAFVEECGVLAQAVPDHCREMVAGVAHEYAAVWQTFAEKINCDGEASA